MTVTQTANTEQVGRGVVVSKSQILTAAHVVQYEGQNKLPSIKFSDGTKQTGTKISHIWTEADLAIVEAPIPSNIVPIHITSKEPTTAWHYGLTWDKQEYVHKVTDGSNSYLFDHLAIPGESGSPMFVGNEVVAILSGGYIRDKRHKSGYWPLIGGNASLAKKYIK